ncbi:protein cholesin isoform X2 [Tamandua tetradactyla]|uniref:protein cholesin isoform X2 n=1 Tax=Tamandua tetradactyla TaxID=48850 RepID=UPI0040546AAD
MLLPPESGAAHVASRGGASGGEAGLCFCLLNLGLPTLPPEEAGAASGEVQGPGPGLSPEEQRARERKQKKERKKEEKQRLREAGLRAAQHVPSQPAKPSGAQLALDYLHSWAQKLESWRFQKTRQTWLLLHMYDRDKVPDEKFPTLLAYLEGLQGGARELTVQKAEALMRELDEAGAGGPDALLAEKTRRVRQYLPPRQNSWNSLDSRTLTSRRPQGPRNRLREMSVFLQRDIFLELTRSWLPRCWGVVGVWGNPDFCGYRFNKQVPRWARLSLPVQFLSHSHRDQGGPPP